MSKTPVSMLHELMQRRGIVPQYDLLPSEGIGTHNPTFYYRCTAEDICTIGKARSKKDAKHEASRLALEALSAIGIYHPDHVTITPSSPVASCSASTSSEVQFNAVGILKDFCAENNIPEPEFELVSDIGPAHLRHFTMKCKIGTMPGISATDLTKKKAKQAAAQKMLQRLKDSLPDIIDEEGNVPNVPAISAEVIDGYNENTLQKKKINWGLKVSTFPQTLKNIMKEKELSFDSIWQNIDQEDIGNLQDLMNKFELSYSVDFLPSEHGETLAFISISSDPEFVLADVGENHEEALKSVLKPTFNFLRIMTK